MVWPEPKLGAFVYLEFFPPPDFWGQEGKCKSEERGEKRETLLNITVGFDF